MYNEHDGFSPAAPILAAFESGVDPANLPGWIDLDASLSPDSPTVLIDMETGELVPHFAELDAGAPGPGEQALYLRPGVLLEGGRLAQQQRRLRARDRGLLRRAAAPQPGRRGDRRDPAPTCAA